MQGPWTPIAYGYHMKAMHSLGLLLCTITYNMDTEISIITVWAAIKVLRGPHGPGIFV